MLSDRLRRVPWAALTLLVGCGPPPEDPGLLLDLETLAPAAPGADPFEAHRPQRDGCPRWAVRAEGDGLEADTFSCHFVSVQAQTARAVPRGATVELELSHSRLHAPEPTLAHTAVILEGRVLLDRQVSIPSTPGRYVARWLADRTLPAGALLVWHLHNHGPNTWQLSSVRLVE